MKRFMTLLLIALTAPSAMAQPFLDVQVFPSSDCIGCPNLFLGVSTGAAAETMTAELAITWEPPAENPAAIFGFATAAASSPFTTPINASNPFTGGDTSGLWTDFDNNRLFSSFEATDLAVASYDLLSIGYFGTEGSLQVDAVFSIDGGTRVSATEQIEIPKPLFGFCDIDGDIDIIDFGNFADSFGAVEGDPNYMACNDTEPDGDVDIIDFGRFADNFGAGAALARVPEPGSAFLAVALFALTPATRRRAARL